MSDIAKLGKREKRQARQMRELNNVMMTVANRAAKNLKGLYEPKFLPDGVTQNPDWNPDAERQWHECSMPTRAALVIAKTIQEHPEADIGRVFGIIILGSRAKSAKEWEAKAKEVEQGRKVIELEAMPKTAAGGSK